MTSNNKNKVEEIENFFKSKKLFFAARSCENNSYSGMVRWRVPLKKFFSNIVIFDTQKNAYIEGQDKMNEHFLDILKKEKPDYLLLWDETDELHIDTLFRIKEISPNTKIIAFYGDDDTLFENHSRYISLISDYHLVAQKDSIKKYKNEGIKNVFFCCGADTENFKRLNSGKKYDVTFVGTSSPDRPDRYDLVKFLKENKINIRVFGVGWEKYPDLKEIYMGHPDNKEVVKIFNESKINLCFSRNNLGQLHFKSRIFDIGACGSFAISEYYNVLEEIFRDGKEIAMFKTKEDLLKKVRYYLENEEEREKIAEAMYKKVTEKNNLYSELSELFKEVYNQKNLPPKKLPSINKKIVVLSKDDFEKGEEFVKNKVRDCDYIAFKKGKCIFSEYKNYLQSYSLISSKKQISCCDYYISSKRIGAYLRSTSYFFNNFTEEERSSVLKISQLTVARSYFLKNLQEFYKVFNGGNIDFISDKNTSFVSIPMLSIEDLRINPRVVEKVFLPRLDTSFSSLVYKNKLFSDKYLYNFLIEVLFFGKFFLLKDIIKRRFQRNKLRTINQLLKLKNNSLYLAVDKSQQSL